jgi:hypothetical protein
MNGPSIPEGVSSSIDASSTMKDESRQEQTGTLGLLLHMVLLDCFSSRTDSAYFAHFCGALLTVPF